MESTYRPRIMRTPPPADIRLYYLQHPAPANPTTRNLQTYFPSLEVLFPSIAEQNIGSPCLAATEIVTEIDSEQKTAILRNMIDKTERSDVPIWIRKMHLVNPVDHVEGEYILPEDGSLPAFRNAWQHTLRKINDPYNEAYTDAVFACMASRLVETGRSPHWCRFYGTFNGRVPTYRYNITPDMPDVEDRNGSRMGFSRGNSVSLYPTHMIPTMSYHLPIQ